MARESLFPTRKSARDPEPSRKPYFPTEVYQAFMEGYVKRINDATLRVPIGGVRIGSARYSRLAQINLRTHIITFSRYAIENVPERGRRYLVIHELSHVKEASHNKRFWQFVAEHEPRYKEIGKELDLAFKQNVRREDRLVNREGVVHQARLFPASRQDDWENFRDALGQAPDSDDSRSVEPLISAEQQRALRNSEGDSGLLYPLDSGVLGAASDLYNCEDEQFSAWEQLEEGIVHGGSEANDLLDEGYYDHL